MPTIIIAAEKDEDVPSSALKIFEIAKADFSRTKQLQFINLLQASHSFFNCKMATLDYSEATISRKQQEEFFMKLCSSFLKSINN